MNKKAIGLLLVLGLTATLAACGGDTGTDTSPSPSPESPAASPESPAASPTTSP